MHMCGPCIDTMTITTYSADNGILNPRDVVLMCLKWMSEDEVKEMCKANEIDLDPRNDDDYPFMCESEDI